MLGLIKLYLVFHLQYILIKCIMPGIPGQLTVRKFDRKLMERKRQDTMEMCRIFTEENEKLEKITELNKSKEGTKDYKRIKRELGLHAINPALNLEDAQRVENIVDKMYEDLLEQGEKVTYRRGNVSAFMVNSNKSTIKSGRKFNFAPAFLGGASPAVPSSPTLPAAITGKTPRFKHGIVPYFIDSKTYDIHLAEIIMKAFDYFEKATCIRLQRLRERPTDRESLQKVEWLYITNPTGIKQCVHSNDRAEIKGVQMIVLGYDCMSLGDITHEMMHVLGFSHEHIRPDRDQYITILWDNIKPGYRKFFELLDKPTIENLPYDYASVLHYPPRAFSRNGQITIMTQPGVKIGQREGLSEIDVEKISMEYSTECVKRNKEYLLKTCPSVVKANTKSANTTKTEIQAYFKDRLWPLGIVNYKIKDRTEFSHEESENIKAVIRHIEKETCIEFRDLSNNSGGTVDEDSTNDDKKSNNEADKKIYKSEKSINDGSNKDSDKDSDGSQLPEQSEPMGTENTDEQLLPESVEDPLESEDGLRMGAGGNANKLSDSDSDRLTGAVSLKSAKKFISDKKSLHLKDNPEKKPTNRVKKPKASKKKHKRTSPSRRHANNILVFTRSAKPGCACPKSPGKPGTSSTVEINADCFNSVNDLLHLFVHILGLDHQHNSHDRDSYLHIVWDQLTDNIRKEMQKTLPPAASVGFPYDYQSVMHYPWLQIKNGRTNIMYPIWNDGWAMGHWQGLSSIDVQKLNLLYYKPCVIRKQLADDSDSKKVTVPK